MAALAFTTYDLPPAEEGMNFTFAVQHPDRGITIAANGIDQILYNALTYVNITSEQAGDCIELICVKAGQWQVKALQGVWTPA